MKKKLFTFLFLAAYSLCSFGQVNVTSPAATEFVRSERIPVGYFNGLPSIDIPLYTLDYKDLHLPIHLSYHASGIKVNQYPTCVGLGWNLNAGGCITRVVNGIPDETSVEDIRDQTGYGYTETNPGYYFYSGVMDRDDWASESFMANHIVMSENLKMTYDLQPDEFVINAYGVSGSVYFYRDKDGKVKTKVKSNNGASFRVETPVMLHNPQDITFASSATEDPLKSYRIHELFYEFTVIKNDGTKLVFGGDYDSIEFYTEKKVNSGSSPYQYMKTLPTAWMLKEVISPDGNKISFEYKRDGNPIIISDVRKDLFTYDNNGFSGSILTQEEERGLHFIIQHPVYPESVIFENGPEVKFHISKNQNLNTISQENEIWMKTEGLSGEITDNICYGVDNSSFKTACAPHNYFMKLSGIYITNGVGSNLRSFQLDYSESSQERLKLNSIKIWGSNNSGFAEQIYTFRYNSLKLPAYNATVTDNWGYWNNKDYRTVDIDSDFFNFRSPDEYYSKAEILTEIQYPAGGNVKLDYELNDYSKVATQAPDFNVIEKSGQAGGLRIKKMTYSTDTTSYIHSFEYKNEDGTSSGILSGIPVYIAQGKSHNKYFISTWMSLYHFQDMADYVQKYKMWSETYVNTLGLTSGNHVTYSRVTEYIGDENPLVKEYRYTNHDSHPDTSDFEMYTNIDNMGLDNEFTSRALMRGLLTDEIWYSGGKKVKDIKMEYNSDPAKYDDFVKSIAQFTIPGVPVYLINMPFARYTPYKILTFYPYLESRTETLYDPNGQTIMSSITESFTYNDNLLPVKTVKNLSDGSIMTQTITYPDDYSSDILSRMSDRGMVSSQVETLTCIDGKVTEGKLVEYALDGSIFIPGKTWTLNRTEGLDSTSFLQYTGDSHDMRYEIETEILDVDATGNPLFVMTADKMPVSYQWGYNSAYPTAVVRNASNNTGTSGWRDFLYEDFESDMRDGIYPFGYESEKCFVGKYYIRLKGDPSRKFLLDYRVYRNGKWDYVRTSFQGISYTINEGYCPIDNVRVWLEDADIETYSWYPLTGLRSRTDGAGVTESYVYDTYDRLLSVKDDSGDIIRKYDYNYAGNYPLQSTALYHNETMSMSFFSTKCNQSENHHSLPVKYTVSGYKYFSRISQADANIQAFDDLVANGQKYADEHGVCEPCIAVYIYNRTTEPYTITFSWGVQGSIQYLDFHIPAGWNVSPSDLLQEDICPTVLYIPRHNYRNVSITKDDGTNIPFSTKSGYAFFDFFYAEGYYDECEDEYIIQ